jgi:SAM-dependent methyltransferase
MLEREPGRDGGVEAGARGAAVSRPEEDEADRIASIQQLWTDGDYAQIGELFHPISVRLVADLDAEVGLAGREVLDAATGTGNTALELADRGAQVHAFDLTPRLLDIARSRATDAGVEVHFGEGDLLNVPFPDARFDLVVSTFGAFTADDHARCAAELLRVCRPGGQVISTAWADAGCFATLRSTVLEEHPELIDPSQPDPGDWARLDALLEMVEGRSVDVQLEQRAHPFHFPSASAAMDLMEEASGPVLRMREGVRARGGDWTALRDRIVARWNEEADHGPDGIVLNGVYGVSRFRRQP